MFLAKKLNKGAGVPTPVDAQFNYVTMLLHGDGTNGAQNNTFLDSSTNNFTITRNGNTTQGSFSPYGSNWSNFFDGSGDYLSAASSTPLNCGTGDFTFECWVYISSRTLNYPLIFGNNNSGYGAGAIALVNSNADSGAYTDRFNLSVYDINPSPTLTASSTNSLNTWYHLAVVRNGTSLVMYRDGTSVASATISSGIVFDWGKLGCRIGGGNWDGAQSYFNGYVSNLRLVKGTAVYTSSFTPSTTPLTAITNTSLLTCQSNRFIDNSTNNATLTSNGDTSVQRFNPFGASTAYSTSVIGGSGYFNGTGDYLQGPTNNAAFQFGTGDFTVEAWVYQTVDDTYPSILEIGDHLATTGILFIKYGTSSAIYSGGFYGASATTMNGWNHIAYVRSSGSLKIYVNGVSPAGVAFTNNLTNSNKVTIGVDQNITTGYYFFGNISNLRVVKGTAVYTANFTPPTTPLTAISGTSLLMPMTNGAIFDNAMMNDLETVGNAQISTSVKKYGTGSIALDGTGDYMTFVPGANCALGTGDFTVEGWFYVTNNLTDIYFFDTRNAGQTSNCWGCGYGQGGTSGRLAFFIGAGAVQTSGSVGSLNTWMHIAFVRASGTLTIYLNGTSVASGSLTDNASTISTLGYIGTRYNQTFDYGGYIDDLRITKGYARYTANFTPPTAAFSDTGPY